MRQSYLVEILAVTMIVAVVIAFMLQTGVLFSKEVAEPQVTVSPDYYRYYGIVNPNGFAEQDVAHVIPYVKEGE